MVLRLVLAEDSFLMRDGISALLELVYWRNTATEATVAQPPEPSPRTGTHQPEPTRQA